MLDLPWAGSWVDVLKLGTLVACKKSLNKQGRPNFEEAVLIRVFPVCYSDKHFVNSSHENQHYILDQKYSKSCLKPQLKNNTKIGFQFPLLLNAVQKYCRMLHVEHSAILSTSIKLPFSIKILVLSLFLSGCLRQVLL